MKRFLFVFFLLVHFSSTAQNATRGILDLSGYSLEKPTALNGEWEFYWKELLLPSDSIPPHKTQYGSFPGLWQTIEYNGNELPSVGYATYRLQLILPRGQNYSVWVEDMYCAFSLYFNGALVAKNGQVAANKKEYIPEWKPLVAPLPPTRDTNELILQIANFDHSKGGARQGITIGTSDVMKKEERKKLTYDLMLTGSLLIGSTFFLGLYFFGHQDKSILMFALFCIIYSYRIAGSGFYALHSVIDIPWHLAVRLEYITLFISTYIFGRFVHLLYPQEAKKIVWTILGFISLSFTAITLVTPSMVFTRLIDPFFIILIIYLILGIVIYLRAWRRKRLGSSYALLNTAVVFVVFIYNILAYFGITKLMDLATFIGYSLFFFSQSMILSYRFAYSLKDARDKAELASQAKTDFLSTISHEIRTPLNAVVGISHLLMENNPREDQKENVASLKFSAEHLTFLINDILDYSKLESGNIEFERIEVNLQEVMQNIYKSNLVRANEKNLEFSLEYDPGITGSYLTDPVRLAQILNNLISNAFKFTKKGKVSLKVTKTASQQDTDTLHFEVEDTGIGISQDKLDIIFERFTQASSSTTREFGGTGLGLSIVRRLLELMGSAIHVNSVPGKGSRFWFDMNIERGNGSIIEKQQKVSSSPEILKGKKILLVEDNPMNVMVASKFLKNWGLEVEVAANGLEAVKKAASGTYDLILMDLQMPVMDGYKASREIRSRKITIPIIALSASAMIRVKEKVLRCGMNDYISKPFDPQDLQDKLLKYLTSISDQTPLPSQ